MSERKQFRDQALLVAVQMMDTPEGAENALRVIMRLRERSDMRMLDVDPDEHEHLKLPRNYREKL